MILFKIILILKQQKYEIGKKRVDLCMKFPYNKNSNSWNSDEENSGKLLLLFRYGNVCNNKSSCQKLERRVSS